MHVAPSVLSALVMLFVTIGPIETAAVFTGVTSGLHRPDRRSLAVRATLIAGVVLLAFALAGSAVLELLHVSLPAFRVAGGILLLLQSIHLTFSSPGLSSLSESERQEAREPGDIAVFPLAFPLIAGPGALSAVVLLMGRTRDPSEALLVLLMLALCLIATLAAMLAAEQLVDRLGKTGADVVSRISGVLLAALAVQFVFDGLSAAPFLR